MVSTAIIISGPEKAGKSSLIKAITQIQVTPKVKLDTRHFSGSKPVAPWSAVGLNIHLAEEDSGLLVWDRSWACRDVYSFLGIKQLPEAISGDWAEKHTGDKVRKQGLTVMLTGDPQKLLARRTADDLPVHPAAEHLAYMAYAANYGWGVIKSQPAHGEWQDGIDALAYVLVRMAFARAEFPDLLPVDVAKERMASLHYKMALPDPEDVEGRVDAQRSWALW